MTYPFQASATLFVKVVITAMLSSLGAWERKGDRQVQAFSITLKLSTEVPEFYDYHSNSMMQ